MTHLAPWMVVILQPAMAIVSLRLHCRVRTQSVRCPDSNSECWLRSEIASVLKVGLFQLEELVGEIDSIKICTTKASA